MSLDARRGIVYVPTGSAAFDFWGGDRHGANLFANSLLALDARTGKRIWHFQFVHHDIWDRDLPAPPNLVSVRHDGRSVDAVAQVTKSGHVFLFDRETGVPLFPIEERPVPASSLAGESAWPTQPVPVRPEPFARQFFSEEQVWGIDEQTREVQLDRFRKAVAAAPYVPFGTGKTILLPGFDGGAEWGGAAVDADGILYVNSNEIPWIASLSDAGRQVAPEDAPTVGEGVYQRHCAHCHGADRSGRLADSVPSLDDMAERREPDDTRRVIVGGQGFMPGFPSLADHELDSVVAWLYGRTQLPAPAVSEPIVDTAPDVPFVWDGYHRFVDERGYPAIEPPWGTLNAIDLNTGEYRWRVPLGELPELSARGIPVTGTENYGGPVVTAGGLVFIAATRDRKFRAFDKESGRILWETTLPAGAYATPATYSVDGRQYVVIAAGGGKMGTASGDWYVAFTLKN